MTKLIRSKLFIGICCIGLAAAVAFLLLPRFYQNQAATEQIVRIINDVPAGTVLTGEMLTISQVGSYGLPADVIRSKEEAVGMIAKETLYAGEYLYGARLQTEDAYNEAHDVSVNEYGQQLSLVTIEFPSSSAGIAGVLRAGDLVDVYKYAPIDQNNRDANSYAILFMKNLYVYDVLNRNLESLSELDAKKQSLLEGDNSNLDFAPAYVVFRCTRSQILTLINLERAKALHLALARAVV